jgi:HAD superfamily hydrolase (TIGR01549 family)
MIKTILWDFDGVILNSMKIKAEGFKSIFSAYSPESIAEIEAYHYANGGVSRFEKIRYFYEKILNKPITEEEIQRLADLFAESIGKYLFDKENLIDDAVSFIKSNYQQYNFHIVSGAEHHELNRLCEVFGLVKYFITIEGSPTPKSDLIKDIIYKYNYDRHETILIGDSINDYEAAKTNQIHFYGYNNPDLKQFDYIESFASFVLEDDV